MKKTFLLVALFLFSLSVAGCGGSDSAPPPTVDTTPPTVLSVTPLASAQNEALRPTISLTFSEAMDQGTVETAFSSVPALPPGTFSWSGHSVSYTPDADLSYSTTYSITVGTGAQDVVGNALANAYSWSFTTRNAPDTTPPTVLAVSPLASAQDVALRPTISVTFSEGMDQGSAQTAFSINPVVTGNFAWDGNAMSYTPAADLLYSTTYSITMGTGAIDSAGNPLVSAYTWSFTVRNAPDTTPPTIDSVTPTNGATGVSATSVISVTFNEAMDQESVEAAFTTSPVVAGSFAWTDNTMMFAPSTSLVEATEYSITVGTGAKDLAGNPLASAYTWSWRTALSYKAIELSSDFGTTAYGVGGVAPSKNGQYLFWWDGPISENMHLYRVKISDLSSKTLWSDRGVWGIYDDGLETWVGNYYPSWATRIIYSDPPTLITRAIHYHSIGLDGNKLEFPYVYFGNSAGEGIGYWKRDDDTTGIISGTNSYVYQSAVIGDKVYLPRGYISSPGIMVIDAVNNPLAIEKTLLSGNGNIASAGDICADETYLYVRNATHEIIKIDPDGVGSLVATFTPGVTFTNMVVVGNYIYSGGQNTKNVYILDKNTGSLEGRDCSAYLPTEVGTPKWDFYNDGIWFGPQTYPNRWAYFLPRSVIENGCGDITPP